MSKLRKRLRLKNFDYKGCYRYFATLATHFCKKYFTNEDTIKLLVDLLKNDALQHQFKVWVYCFMPDHLHILIEGKMENSDFKKFIKSFKQKSGFEFQRKFNQKFWQENYYEHVLRREEDTVKVVRYVLNNPVRAGLVKNFNDYPFIGSFEININDL